MADVRTTGSGSRLEKRGMKRESGGRGKAEQLTVDGVGRVASVVSRRAHVDGQGWAGLGREFIDRGVQLDGDRWDSFEEILCNRSCVSSAGKKKGTF